MAWHPLNTLAALWQRRGHDDDRDLLALIDSEPIWDLPTLRLATGFAPDLDATLLRLHDERKVILYCDGPPLPGCVAGQFNYVGKGAQS